MNKSILLSLISIFAVVGLVGGLTVAYFSDQGTSNDNVFATGTLNLQLDDVDQTAPTESVTASFGNTNLSPGASTAGWISLHNGGSLNIAEIKFGANQTANNSGDSNLADVLDLTVKTGDDTACTVSAVDHTATINAAIGAGSPNLTLTELNSTDYDSLPGLAASGTDKYLCVTFTMQSTAGDTYQGDSITEDFIFEAHQNASQT